jgi:hypothetical protein
MAALGGIVSAHAPQNVKYKRLYAVAFIALGAVGLYFVVRQSKESAQAGAQLSTALSNLSDAAKESARVGALNTQLQERLLAQSDTIKELSMQNIDEVTGGRDFVVVFPASQPIDGTGMALVAEVHGSHAMRNVQIEVAEDGNITPAREQLSDVLAGRRITGDPFQTRFVGDLPVWKSQSLRLVFQPSLQQESQFVINSYALNGVVNELLDVRYSQAAGWQGDFVVRRFQTKGGKWREIYAEGWKHPRSSKPVYP